MTAWSRCFGGSEYSVLSRQLRVSRTLFDLVRPKAGARDSGLGTSSTPLALLFHRGRQLEDYASGVVLLLGGVHVEIGERNLMRAARSEFEDI
jgi:hypothetical protein